MFEAHFTKSEDSQGLETVVYSWEKTYYRQHKLSFEPLKIWFAHGQRKLRSGGAVCKIFAYVEYQDEQGNSRYRCLELDAGLTVVEALGLASEANLSDLRVNA